MKDIERVILLALISIATHSQDSGKASVDQLPEGQHTLE